MFLCVLCGKYSFADVVRDPSGSEVADRCSIFFSHPPLEGKIKSVFDDVYSIFSLFRGLKPTAIKSQPLTRLLRGFASPPGGVRAPARLSPFIFCVRVVTADYFFAFMSSRRFLIISSAMLVGTSLYLEKFIVNVPCPLVAPRRSLA